MKYPQLVSMPSAVSDWLEEQLEARGIDAVVYTRYVLSLLYRDPVDIICPDQDLHFTNPNKEIRRCGGGRKRFCRSTDYWGHAHADTDQLKRSAAVECLKSASDQKCGIESLVDELCEKLKQVKSDSSKLIESTFKPSPERKSSIQDPAKQYYAAFPALSRAGNSSSVSPNLITLIPKWFGSPKKKGPRRQNRSSSYEDKLHFKVDTENMKARSSGKQRCYNYFSRNKKDLGYCRAVSKSIERPDSMAEWDFYGNKRNIKNLWDDNKDKSWIESEESMNMYEDLPVDIRDLLDSPTPQDVSIDMMNMANMRETGSRKFIQCGTNITSSIWSNDAAMDYDNSYNTNLDQNQSESMLDFKFSSISINRNAWSTDIKQNETNSYFENFGKSNYGLDTQWNFEKMEKWSDNFETEEANSVLLESLMKLNHNREESPFIEVKPKARPININNKHSLSSIQEANKRKMMENEKEDLLSSVKSHFKPINEKVETRTNGQYADGTTFVIPNCLDKVNFKRSASGMMYLDGTTKKYLEFRKLNDELTLKFNIHQNDRGCQTDDGFESDAEMVYKEECEFYFPGDQEISVDDDKETDGCSCGKPLEDCQVHNTTRPDSVMAEIFGKSVVKCDKCNKNAAAVWGKDWRADGKQNIWSGGEVCMACLDLSGGVRPPPSQERNQLRDDIKQDGEQLLSDLSSLQKCYMEEELPIAEPSCDLNELIGAKEWQSIPIHSGSFSFATRLQEDCLMKMATIPTLRSVTL